MPFVPEAGDWHAGQIIGGRARPALPSCPLRHNNTLGQRTVCSWMALPACPLRHGENVGTTESLLVAFPLCHSKMLGQRTVCSWTELG
eukprot:CAMPEP_0183420098 /NCGR_PEP_ID=MMETSP0370-20130417/26236_1 /TAXON_ID=268820 /ORGANISM="Peridinium aciculiferum, Strain PAER-2" /LENGTH=87 /DNA_ID=CAMNT_0025603959 /DNA_START=65 /DNA_END=325 /DNA_ORIENTATION=+